MKNIYAFPILCLFIALCTFSCKKDEVSSPCEGISCSNGGTCVNGECDCPDGFEGPDCSDQQTPSSMRITNITCTSFPATDNGAGWDLSSGCDIYVTLERNGNVFYEHPTFYQNANPSLDYEFTPTSNVSFGSPLDTYIIRLYDYDDFDTDDYMGGISFTPYNSTNGFPTTRVLDAGGSVSFELEVEYIF